MKRYLLIIHRGGPVIGAVEVPPCFEIKPQLALEALKGGMSFLIVTEEELAPKGGLEGLLLAQGRSMLDALNILMTDPSFFDRLLPDHTQN
ncbi:MAG TPA: hypothetical protein VFI41_04665 [Gemmatimonadales bacterium]|nr:hypothetical protein [Gemmatimonadales bacterium]